MTLKVNNNITQDELHDNKSWIHYTHCVNDSLEKKNNKTINFNDIKLTIFLITICTEQLQHSLKAINNLQTQYPIIVNVIMNVSPTNKAYNEMRLRCTTPYFIQNDEDMELLPNAIDIFYKYMKKKDTKNKIFLHTFKLIDTCLGIGTPPIIDCLKLYNHEIMKLHPTYLDGKKTVSSVDQLWHKPLIEDNYLHKNTNVIIGYHGKHRSNFDLMLRHCKIFKSIVDPKIKTNSGHICKLLRSLCINNNSEQLIERFKIILQHFLIFCSINKKKLNEYVIYLNSHVKQETLAMYNITRTMISEFDETDVSKFNECFFKLFKLKTSDSEYNKNDKEQFFCIIAILCVITDNYEYSFDKYPTNIYDYFNNILCNLKTTEPQFIYDDTVDNTIEYDNDKNIYTINKLLKKF
jgi:hypothetical protein